MKKKKLTESQTVNPSHLRSGIEFGVKYLGDQCIEDIQKGQLYHSNTTSGAIHAVIAMNNKAGKRKFPQVVLNQSTYGITVKDASENSMILDAPIERIAYCTADKIHDKVFAFICRNAVNETVQIHVFKCPKSSVAVAMALNMNEIFRMVAEERQQVQVSVNDPQEQSSAWCEQQKVALATAEASSRNNWTIF